MSKEDNKNNTRISKYKKLRSQIDNNFLNLTNQANIPSNKEENIDYYNSKNYLLLSKEIKDLIKRLERIAPYFEFYITGQTDSVENSINALMKKNNSSIHADDIVTPSPLRYDVLNQILEFENKVIVNEELLFNRNKEMSFNDDKENLKLIINGLINNSNKLPENMFKKRNELLELLFNIIKEKESNTKNETHLNKLKKEYYSLINADTTKIEKKEMIKKKINYDSSFIKKLLIISIITSIITCVTLIIIILT